MKLHDHGVYLVNGQLTDTEIGRASGRERV